MKRYRRTATAVVGGLGALALLAAPSLAAGSGDAATSLPVQLAHMSPGGHMYQGGGAAGGPGAGRSMGPGMMGPGMMGPGMMGPGMMGPGATGRGACPGATGSAMGPGMMRGGMMGMMGPGMMGMMGPSMTGRAGFGWGMRVTHTEDVTVDDVRHFFKDRLALRGNKRLKVGTVKEADEDTIIADIVTVDDSLVQRFKIDRHTGFVRPAEQ